MIEDIFLKSSADTLVQLSGRIEDCLGETSEPERSALLGELLVLELAYRRRRGDRPTSEEYRRRFPEHGELIH